MEEVGVGFVAQIEDQLDVADAKQDDAQGSLMPGLLRVKAGGWAWVRVVSCSMIPREYNLCEGLNVMMVD